MRVSTSRTTVQPNPPAALTPAREAEIHAQQSRGEGKFIVQSLTAGGAAYIVEYQLADGTVFRVGDDRPVMSDAEWERTRAEAQRLYAAGQYERNTVTGLDGTSVPVIEMTLSSGYHAVIPDNPTVIHFTWGLVEITPQRAAEIEALRSRGAGTLVEQLFAPDETTYLVDYQLADGTVVRAKDDRPVMSAAEWESTRAEARRTRGSRSLFPAFHDDMRIRYSHQVAADVRNHGGEYPIGKRAVFLLGSHEGSAVLRKQEPFDPGLAFHVAPVERHEPPAGLERGVRELE